LGHKVHPYGFRIGITKDWLAKWYDKKHYAEFLQEDLKLRTVVKRSCKDGGVAYVELDRQGNEIVLTLYSSRPGVIIGRGGQRAEELRTALEKACGKRVRVSIKEVEQPELEGNLVAQNVAEQIVRRIAFRRAMKQAAFRTMQAGAKGVKITCSGRLGGNEIARSETTRQGRLPLHTIIADISYGFAEAVTAMGNIGVKAWIYKGNVIPEGKKESATTEESKTPQVA
jgi:small subunit ribosomal protein S3